MRKVLHLICQAHLDPVWLWPWREGAAEALTTMQSAVDRLGEFPDMRFTQSSAALYRWVGEQDPRLLAAIRDLVAAGRWEIAGDWIVEADVNLPSTASLLKQVQLGRAALAELGLPAARVAFHPDGFGHSAGLPGLLQAQGYQLYLMMRPHEWEYTGPRPGGRYPRLFRWRAQGPDAGEILTARVATSYCQGPGASDADVAAHVRRCAEEAFDPGCRHGLCFIGVGNHGGGPTVRHLTAVQRLMADDDLPELRFSTLGEYLDAVLAEHAPEDFPVIADELQHHARGCYLAHGETKQAHARAESLLAQADALDALEPAHDGRDLDAAWWELGFHQFHDILPGSSIPSASARSVAGLDAAAAGAEQAVVRRVHRLARRIDTSRAGGGVLVAVNPLPWERTATLSFPTWSEPNGGPTITHLRAPDGQRLPLQWLPAESAVSPHGQGWGELTAAVPLPAGGWRAWETAAGDPGSGLHPADRSLRCDPIDGGVELRDAERSCQLRLVAIDDPSDTWGHGITRYDGTEHAIALSAPEVISGGPVLRLLRLRAEHGQGRIELDLLLWRHAPACELRLRARWPIPRQVLKLCVAADLDQVTEACGVPGGLIERGDDGDEHPFREWLAVSGTDPAGKAATCACYAEGLHSYDRQGAQLRLGLLRTAPFAEHGPHTYRDDELAWLPLHDQGWQRRRAVIELAPGSWRSRNPSRHAAEWLTPAQHVMDSIHPGDLPWSGQGVAVTPACVAVHHLQRVGDELRLVVQNQHELPVTATITIDGATMHEALPPHRLVELRCALPTQVGATLVAAQV